MLPSGSTAQSRLMAVLFPCLGSIRCLAPQGPIMNTIRSRGAVLLPLLLVALSHYGALGGSASPTIRWLRSLPTDTRRLSRSDKLFNALQTGGASDTSITSVDCTGEAYGYLPSPATFALTITASCNSSQVSAQLILAKPRVGACLTRLAAPCAASLPPAVQVPAAGLVRHGGRQLCAQVQLRLRLPAVGLQGHQGDRSE